MTRTEPVTIGPYEVGLAYRRRSGSTVHRARDLRSGAVVDLEVIASSRADDLTFQGQVSNRGARLAALGDPGIVEHLGVETDDGVVAIATAAVPGTSLRQLIAADGPLAPARAAALLEQVAATLDRLHAARLVHAALTTDAIVVDGDRAWVRDVTLTPLGPPLPGRPIDDADTFAPERLGQLPDGRSDVYGLGCVALEALTGSPPFPGGGNAARLAAHSGTPPPVPSQVRPQLGTAFDAPIARALEKDPARRQATAGELAADLLLAGEQVSDPPPATVAPVEETADATPPTLIAPAVTRGRAGDDHPPVGARPERDPGERRTLLVLGGAGGLAAVVLVAIVALVALGGDGDPAPPQAADEPSAVPAQPDPPARPPSADPTPGAIPSGGWSGPASVRIGGRPAGSGSATVRVGPTPGGGETATIAIAAAGAQVRMSFPVAVAPVAGPYAVTMTGATVTAEVRAPVRQAGTNLVDLGPRAAAQPLSPGSTARLTFAGAGVRGAVLVRDARGAVLVTAGFELAR